MRWFGFYRTDDQEQAERDQEFLRVNLPRLTRPNLVARLYMLFTATGTAGIGWGLPSSATARIMESGGATAHAIIATMVLATTLGLLDVIVNDGFALQSVLRADGLMGRFVAWLEDRRTPRCFVIGGCYLILTFAGFGSSVPGTFWLLLYYGQMTLCAGLLGWSLRALMLAKVAGERSATT